MVEKALNKRYLKTLRYIRNYLVHFGSSPSIRDIQRELGYSSPRSAHLIVKGLIEEGFLKRKADGNLKILRDPREDIRHARTVEIPLVGIVSCGQPLLAEENIEVMISVSKSLIRPRIKYFLLRAQGDSMTKAGISDGDLVLVKQQPTAKNRDIIVALIDDEATIKEYHDLGDMVVLKPKSHNSRHRPIILKSNFQVQGVVIATIPNPDR